MEIAFVVERGLLSHAELHRRSGDDKTGRRQDLA
jgi:hypothetical protein